MGYFEIFIRRRLKLLNDRVQSSQPRRGNETSCNFDTVDHWPDRTPRPDRLATDSCRYYYGGIVEMMECFTCIGLLLDIAGVTLLWFFGIPNIVSINKTNEVPTM